MKFIVPGSWMGLPLGKLFLYVFILNGKKYLRILSLAI
jgi:hypothetical protein